MSASITKGPAFEIRFCEGNKVQVFDLSKKGDQSGNQLLPNEYLEDDVVNGRLRYSKLGNQWLSDDAGTHQQTLAAIPDDQQKRTNIQKKTDDNLDIIPVVAKRKAIEDAKELESIRQGEEAMRKAMERKKKIEMVRRAREQAAAAKEEGTTAITESSMTATVATTNQNNDTQEGPTAKNKDYRDTNMESKNEQDPQYQFEHEKV
ncbi:hypothetical protein BC941DRAFT_451236 [Chlamydoabsidia padenii]|nr:hypothetical protein BC941DRAFT_451236 [Chlamydoabsidia padenii]